MSNSVGSRMDGSAGPVAMANGPVSTSTDTTSSTLGPPSALEEPSSEPQSSLTDVTQMWVKFAKTFAIILPIYILGYFEFSFSWVLIGLAALFYWRRTHGSKDYRINRALAFLEHKDIVVKKSLPTTDLPSWVHYPDVERVEWLNKTVKQMWPFICQFVDKLFRDTIEPAVKGANPHLSSFCFTKIDMGDKPLRVNGVKVYTENVDKRQVIMDLQISFVGNTEIDVDIKKYYCRAGIKSIQLHGVMRVVMEPLLGDMPLIGALSVFFLKKPLLDINWTGLTNMLDIPGVNGLCDSMIQDIIYSFVVLPNRITIPLVGEAQLDHLLFPVPKGILRIHFIEAQDLLGKDKFLGGLIKGKSDPYGVIRVGKQLFQSKVIHETVHPKWNAVYEAEVMDPTGHNLEVQLYDEDADKDDPLGSVTIDIAELAKDQTVDEWFGLDGVASGKLHLKLEWLSLLSTPDKLDQALASIRADRGKANDGLSSALLVVFLDSARNLPQNPLEFNQGGSKKASLTKVIKSAKKVTSDPSPFVQLRVGHKSHESKTRYKTHEPVWEEAFSFLIHNPRSQDLEIEVKDAKHECSLGTLIVPLSRLLEAEDMTLNQQFPLKTNGPSCTIKMKMALRVLCLVGKEASLTPDPNPSSTQLRKSSSTQQSSSSDLPTQESSASHIPRSASVSAQNTVNRRWDGEEQHSDVAGGRIGGQSVAESRRSTSNLTNMGSQQILGGGKEATPSIASDISNPYATQELQQRLQQLQNGSGPNSFPLGEIQLTVRHSSQRNKLVVVVHACRNLISFTDHGSDPYVRLYLLPDKRRSGRRKTHTLKKTLNPVYDQTFEFSVSLVELHRRTLDAAVKNGGGLLSKHKGLLGKVLVDLTHEDMAKGWTQWYELSEEGLRKPHRI
uniref:extended synaptotagmin-2-like isoform X1 n=1 Tax=Doryrhamphus excisus TaxID=161450 RepID=UPI0025ADC05A|nr:extended synaptotagmin-2-like isoform X1 [Doryrhamphus excisus]XP_057934618.1 extended synaptotagmin-2-like isoform X1 [Doryrhamphus excisus]